MNGKRNYSQFIGFQAGFLLAGTIHKACVIRKAFIPDREFGVIDPKKKPFSIAGTKCKKISNVLCWPGQIIPKIKLFDGYISNKGTYFF